MRKAIQRKLCSRRGASLLLALLFLLICSMVSASILMAAVSNAGKRRSNLEEHQTYLALSSAVSLLCDELNQAEYRGQYNFWETTHTETIDDEEYTYQVPHFRQVDGAYSSDLATVLLDNFDSLFAEYLKKAPVLAGVTDKTMQPASALAHTLTVTPNTGTALDTRPVQIELTVVAESYAMELTATLDDYRIRAELTPSVSHPTLPSTLTPMRENDIQRTDPLQWRIGWITVGEEEDDT